MNNVLLKATVVLCFILAGLALIFARDCDDEAPNVITQSDTESLDETSSYEDVTASKIYVHICGAVKSPGLYGLPEGSRVSDAIETAGGFTDDADIDYWNLAQVVTDGMQIAIPTRDAAADKSDGMVNINTGSVEELMTLPGIGQARAESIVAYRKEHGMFSCIEDIMNIPGIKESAFSKIKDKIKV